METKHKVLAGIGAVLGTIVLGAIGSGLWERCFAPLCDHIVKVVVSLMGLISNTYKNSIYLEASKGFHEYSSLFLHTFFLAMFPLLYLRLLYRHPHARDDKVDDKMRDFVRSRAGYRTLMVMTCAVMITFFLDLVRTTYINTVVTVTQQSIAILAPQIDDSESKRLWASFYSMSNEKDFTTFKSRLTELATDKSVAIPEFPGLWSRQPNKRSDRTGDPRGGPPTGQP